MRGQFNFDFVGKIRTYGLLSGTLVSLSILSISTLGLEWLMTSSCPSGERISPWRIELPDIEETEILAV